MEDPSEILAAGQCTSIVSVVDGILFSALATPSRYTLKFLFAHHVLQTGSIDFIACATSI
jgi:hypothetical protein